MDVEVETEFPEFVNEIPPSLESTNQEFIAFKKTPIPITHITDDTFEKIVRGSKDQFLIVVSAKWCAACVRFEQELKKFVALGQANVKVLTVDISESPATTARLLVFKIPTLIQYWISSLITSYVNQSFYVLDSHFNEKNLTLHFQTESWKEMIPRMEIITPFSPCGRVLATTAAYGNKFIGFVEDMKKEYSPTVIYGVIAIIPIILIILILLLSKKSTTRAQESKKKREKQDPESKKNK